MVVVGAYFETSGIVMHLRHKSVVCLNNYMLWLRRLYSMVLFVVHGV